MRSFQVVGRELAVIVHIPLPPAPTTAHVPAGPQILSNILAPLGHEVHKVLANIIRVWAEADHVPNTETRTLITLFLAATPRGILTRSEKACKLGLDREQLQYRIAQLVSTAFL